ncbi:AI-2E family transporter [Limosilactobacillus caecicola]|uniref:AI-2E family transporter n=1 Tax=Limosilactobacillus caecicola TaxID=2941332 RepID=UPI00203C7CD3|nr:AI-2E family transporter [Limosilactobacillus caecicola]
MLNKKAVLFWTIEILLVVTLIWVCTKIKFVFHPFLVFISVVFVPVIISLFLYYMLRPVLKLLLKVHIGKHYMPRGVASIIIVLALILIVVGVISAIIPPMVNELTQIVKGLPTAAKETEKWLIHLSKHPAFKDVDFNAYYKQMTHRLSQSSETILQGITSQAGNVIGMVTSTVIVAITVPVMLFYMLKDSDKFVPSIQKYFSKKHGEEVGKLLHQMNATLSSYISGQAIECIFVAIATSIGYLIIGQPAAIILGLVAGATNMIPYVGPYIGIAPALMVAIAVAPQKIIWVIVVVLIVQQIDGNIIYPNIIGKSLQIHPLTIIMLLLAAGNIAGIPGMILCIPFYAVVKTIFNYVWSIYQVEKGHQQ